MRKLRIRAGILSVVLLTGMVMYTGCGAAGSAAVPELIEPAAANSSYRPVELGEIGETKVLYGTIVPKDYCSFYHTNADISEITVEVGDSVEEGEIVAYANTDAAKEDLEELNADLANENQNYNINSRITQARIHQIEVAEMDEGERATRLATEQENQRYDKMLHDYRVGKLNESIAEQQEIIEEGTLRARHAGTVSYIKNTGKTTSAGAYENIVIVSDPQDTCIELEKTIGQYAYTDYEEKFMKLAGGRYDVAEIPYSLDETILAKASNLYPNVRMECPDAGELPLGASYPVYFQKEKVKEVPVIGLDSLYGEKNDYFVYVKRADGGREKRAVTIGDSDDNYAEVTDGLTEGEQVFYASDARMPAKYEEYTVEIGNYEIANISRSYDLENERTVWYDAPYEGTIEEIAVKKGAVVEEGELLYVIDSGVGKAALRKAKNQINHENKAYVEAVADIDERLAVEIDEDMRSILSSQRELESVNHAYRLRKLQKEYNRMAKNNDGNGKVSVYARQGGTVSNINFSSGDIVTTGAHVISVGEAAGNKILVHMNSLMPDERNYPENIADFGEEITITLGETDYTGRCIGWAAQPNNVDKAYLTSDEDGAYLSLSYGTDSGYSVGAFFVEMDDESFYEKKSNSGKVSFLYISMQDVIVIPTSLVHEETRAEKPAQTFYYVWRVIDGELVKQYVLVDKSLSGVNKTVILSGVKEQDVLAREK